MTNLRFRAAHLLLAGLLLACGGAGREAQGDDRKSRRLLHNSWIRRLSRSGRTDRSIRRGDRQFYRTDIQGIQRENTRVRRVRDSGRHSRHL